jgi:hypothetical protein
VSLRRALCALHADPHLNIDALPDAPESLEIVSGLILAIERDLVEVHEDGRYTLSVQARMMVEQPVALVRVA